MRQFRDFHDYLIEEELSDPKESLLYLEAAFEEYLKDGDTTAFMLALRNIDEAQGTNLSNTLMLSAKEPRKIAKLFQRAASPL